MIEDIRRFVESEKGIHEGIIRDYSICPAEWHLAKIEMCSTILNYLRTISPVVKETDMCPECMSRIANGSMVYPKNKCRIHN